MANVNISAVMDKVNAFSKSNTGSKKINEYIDKCVKDGRGVTEAGSTIVTKQAMIRAAETLIMKLKESASQYNLPNSVREHFNSLRATAPYESGKQGYKIDITFEDDLSRMSLLITSGKNSGQHTGEGISNIIALFNNGYDASSKVFGLWESHGENISSLTHRDSLNFMESTVESFNREWGNFYNAYAYISSEQYR